MTFFGILNVFVEGGIVNTLFNFYQLGFGIVTLGLESHKPIINSDFKSFLFEYFRFMFTLVGRGCFYLLVGILITCTKPWTNYFVGMYTMATGVAALVYGYKANSKLAQLKFKFDDEVDARQKFKSYDTDEDNCITFVQFATLLEELKIDLSHNELEAAISLISNDMKRTIHVDSFCEWYHDLARDEKIIASMVSVSMGDEVITPEQSVSADV